MSKVVSTEPIVRKYAYFDPETLEEKETPITVNFTPATDYQSAVARFGNDTDALLEALNAKLQRDAFTAARREVRGQGIPRSVINTFIKPYRESAQFKDMSYGDQTRAILEQVKSIPFMLNALKDAAAKAAAEGTEEDEPAA